MNKITENELRLELLNVIDTILPNMFEVMEKGLVNIKLKYSNTRLFYIKEGKIEKLCLGPSNERKGKRLVKDVIVGWDIEHLGLLVADLARVIEMEDSNEAI